MLRTYSEVLTHTHTNLQHPGGHHPAHERLDVLLYAFEIGALRQKPLLDGQKALQHPVIAQEVRVRTGSQHGFGFQTIQLHSCVCFLISKTPANWSRRRRLRRRACKASVCGLISCAYVQLPWRTFSFSSPGGCSALLCSALFCSALFLLPGLPDSTD